MKDPKDPNEHASPPAHRRITVHLHSNGLLRVFEPLHRVREAYKDNVLAQPPLWCADDAAPLKDLNSRDDNSSL